MKYLTPEQHDRMMRYAPELRLHQALLSQALASARALDKTTDEEERAVRESVLKDLLDLLADVWVKCAALKAVSEAAEALCVDEEIRKVVNLSEMYDAVIDKSLPLAERVDMLRKYSEFRVDAVLEHGARPHLDEVEDGYNYGDESVKIFLTSFVFEFEALLQIAVRTYRTIKLHAEGKKNHLSIHAQGYLYSVYASLYGITCPVVQILNLKPELRAMLIFKGVLRPHLLKSFVSEYAKNADPHHAMANLLRAKGYPETPPNEIASS